MTRTHRSIEVAQASERRIRSFAYWARRHIVIRTNRSDREQRLSDEKVEEALAALRRGDIRKLRP